MIMLLLTVLVFLLILSVLVLIHEAGHYFVAKWFGIKVEEFAFGFPVTPALFSFKKGETVYSFYPVLIGGFVKLYGEDEAGGGKMSAKVSGHGSKKDLHRAFFSRPIWQRGLVIVAGVVMNVLLAAAIYYVFLATSHFKSQEFPLIGDHKFFLVNEVIKTEVIITEVLKNSPAEQAGMHPLSRIISVNGQRVPSAEAFSATIKENRGKEVALEWEDVKTLKRSQATVVPRLNPPPKEGALGIAFFPSRTFVLSYDTPEQRLLSGFSHPINMMSYQFDVLGKLIGISVKEKNPEPVRQSLSGPVGIGFYVGAVITNPAKLVDLAGLLSISLAFFNVLPIPGLDGGRLFFIILEALTGKKVDPKIEGFIHSVGMSLLLLLMVFVTWNDIQMHQAEIMNFFKHLINP